MAVVTHTPRFSQSPLRHSVLVAVTLVLTAGAAAAQSHPSPAVLRQETLSGVRVGNATSEALVLSLKDAVEQGLNTNLGVLLGRQTVRAAQGHRQQSLSALLPHLAVTSTVNLQQLNIRAQEGIQFPGLPSVVGPFTYFDTRFRLTQSLFDLPAILQARAGSEVLEAAEYGYQDARDQVILMVGTTYLQTVAHAARVRSVEAQRETAQALHAQAVDRLKAGTTPVIDLLRAKVQLQTREQQLIGARNELAKQKLTLARLIGLPLAQSFTVEDVDIYSPLVSAISDDVLRGAYAARADYQALEAQTRNLELQRKAASARSAPALTVSVDYGAVGVTPGNASRTVGGFAAVTIPIFQGGEIRGEVAQADAALAQSRARRDDLRGRIEQEVRSAMLDLESAAEQVRVATSIVNLATQTLQQARDRFVAGVTDNIEVVQAQEAVASGSETVILSEYMYGVAVLQLARAMGNAETASPDLLKDR